jgi:hypothetical protein
VSRFVLWLGVVLAVVIAANLIEHLVRPLLPVLVAGVVVLAVYKLMFQRRW